jgi:hypothetical protein
MLLGVGAGSTAEYALTWSADRRNPRGLRSRLNCGSAVERAFSPYWALPAIGVQQSCFKVQVSGPDPLAEAGAIAGSRMIPMHDKPSMGQTM